MSDAFYPFVSNVVVNKGYRIIDVGLLGCNAV